MTREQYVSWVATRGEDAALWERKKCYAADALIRKTAIGNFKKYMRQFPEPIRTFTYDCAAAHFGAVEVDDMFTKLNMYPDWM